MARNQTFSVSLNLLTKNFNRGIKSIQNSLRSLRAQFQTFVGGIGVGLGFQELIDNAKQLDKVEITLKNVSGTYETFGKNQEFVMGLAKKYNQDLITLTGNFAKFYSSASYAGMSLQEQQHIYESLTRASAYFNLTADETNGVFLAIQQMISKGRVSSEELRRQLGERLPGALNLAAKAMGVSTAKLEEMLKKGELLAVDLLPKLADELNGLTINLDVNTIQGATNQLRNTFTELVKKLKVGDIYKGFLNGVSGGLDYLNKNLKDVAYAISAVLGTLFLKSGMERGLNGWNSFFKNIENKLEKSKAESRVLRAEFRELARDSNIRYKVTGGPNGRINVSDAQPYAPDTEKLEEAKNLAKSYNDKLREQSKLQDQLNNKIGTMGKRLWNSVKSIGKLVGIQVAYYAVAAAISIIITNLVKWRQELKRIKNITKDTKAEYDKLATTLSTQDTELENARINDDDTDETKGNKIKVVNRLLRLEEKQQFSIESSNEEINAAIDKRLDILKKEREYQAANQVIAEKRSRIEELTLKRKEAQEKLAKIAEQKKGIVGTDVGSQTTRDNLGKLERKELKNIDLMTQEIDNLNKAIGAILVDSDYQKLAAGKADRDKVLNYEETGNISPEDEKQQQLIDDYNKIQKEHNNKLRALNEQLADEVIDKEEYDKAFKDLYISTLDSIYALNNINENTDPFAKAILSVVKSFEKTEKKEDKVAEELEEYFKKASELKRQYVDGIITMDELDDELFNLREETVKAISSMGKLSESAAILANTYKKQKADRAKREIGELEAPEMGELDTTLNYKKSNSDIYQENADFIEDYANQLENLIDNLSEYKDKLSGADLETLNSHIDTLQTNLEELTMSADSFAQAAKFAEVQEDIANMKTELAQGIWDNITGIAEAAERLTNSFKSLQETWDDPDASGWEKFITTFTTIISVIETIVSVIKTFQTAMSIAEGLSLAMAAAEQAQIPVKTQELILTKAQAAAAKELAMARGMQSAAAVPYPANLVAIASTAGALAAAFAAVPKFAHGGYVKSNSLHGDRNLVRVNGNELILNTQQQGTLFKLLNGQGSPLNKVNNVTFKIHGSDLVGTINNYTKKIGK